MRLDVLPSPPTTDPTRVLAMADQAYSDLCAAGIGSEQLDLGVAICSPQFKRVLDVNRLFLARVPTGVDVVKIWESTQEWFRRRNSRCLRISMSRMASDNECLPLSKLLMQSGWVEQRREWLRLSRAIEPQSHDYKIISARSAMRLYEVFAQEAAENIEPQLADVSINRLDEPQYEALVAMVEGKIVARAALMTSGETGLIEQVHVLEKYRQRGLGRAVMQAAIDLAARAQFRHVLLSCDAKNLAAQNLYAKLGFVRLGDRVTFCDPAILS